jgi:PAS domain S-box-containing protein
LERPGPTILYVNPAFNRMSGYAASEVLGNSPRLLQGAGKSPETTRMVVRNLREKGRFRRVLKN